MKLHISIVVAIGVVSFAGGYLLKPGNSVSTEQLHRSSTDTASALASIKKVQNTHYEVNSAAPVQNLQKQISSTLSADDSSALNKLYTEHPNLIANHFDINRILGSVAYDLLETDPGAAAQLLDLFTDSNMREGVKESVIAVWSEKDAQSTLAWLEEKMQSGNKEFDGYYGYALNSLAQQNPYDAMARFQTLEQGHPGRSAILQGMAKGFGTSDPQAGFAWLQEIQDLPDINPQEVDSAYKDLMLGYMNLDRDAAAEAISQIGSTQLQAELARPLVMQYAKLGFENAVEYVESLDNEAVRRAAASQFAELSGHEYPEKMVDFAIQHANDNSEGQGFLRQTFMSLTLNDSDKALSQYKRLEGPAKQAAMESIAYTLSRTDGPHVVEGWINNFEDVNDRDNGYAALAVNSGKDPVAAFKSITKITSTKKQLTALETVVAQAKPNMLFDIQNTLYSHDLHSSVSKKVEKLIEKRIGEEYSSLSIPSASR